MTKTETKLNKIREQIEKKGYVIQVGVFYIAGQTFNYMVWKPANKNGSNSPMYTNDLEKLYKIL